MASLGQVSCLCFLPASPPPWQSMRLRKSLVRVIATTKNITIISVIPRLKVKTTALHQLLRRREKMTATAESRTPTNQNVRVRKITEIKPKKDR